MMTLRVTSRLVLLVCVLFLTMVLMLWRCGLNSLDDLPHNVQVRNDWEKRYDALLQDHRTQMAALKERISNLEAQLQHKHENQIPKIQNQDFYNDDSEHVTSTSRSDIEQKLVQFLKETVQSSEIINGVEHSTEYDLIPFDRFTYNRIYLAHPGLGKRVVEKPIGYKRRELNEVLTKALAILNSNATKQFEAQHFLEGVYRTEPKLGTHYELFFKQPEESLGYRKLVFTRPFAPVQTVVGAERDRKELINLILPLSGRYDTFIKFMDYFTKICINNDKSVFLTVVYFGMEGLDNVRNLLRKVSKTHNFESMKLISLNETFSRGRGLQAGVESWKSGEVLLFLCDVDIVFTVDYLRRCRLHTEKGLRVYYPVVFSLYNPKAVYSLLNTGIPHTDQQLVISKSTGFWRDFGYGMTCQYRSDFLRVGGFPQVTGWGLEDVLLYRKYVKSKYMVVRAPDPGIFHMWHAKVCERTLPPDQYRGCIQSKALNEAPHEYLGVLAFKEEFEFYKQMRKNLKATKTPVKKETIVKIR